MFVAFLLAPSLALDAGVERVHVGQDAAVHADTHLTVRRDRSRQEPEKPDNTRVEVLVSDRDEPKILLSKARRAPPVVEEDPAKAEPVVEKEQPALVRNTSMNTRKALVQVEEQSQVEAQGPLDAILFGCFRKVGRVGTGLCACLFGAALAAAMHKACCGERSCWYTWPCCKRARLASGMDAAKVVLQMTVHRARDLPVHGGKCSIAVLPRRGHSKKPKLSTSSVLTAATDDLKWEQPLRVVSEQGCDTIQLAAYKKAVLGKGTLLGWGDLKIKDVLEKPVQKEWITLRDEGGACVGSVSISCAKARDSSKAAKGRDAKSGAACRDESPTEELTEAEKLQHLKEALCGPLNQANATGQFKLRYFRIEEKRGVMIWAWYKDKHINKDTKPAGRIPLVSITNIYEVPNSIAEFFVRYRDATDKVVDMMLERTDRPRELWVKSMHKMVTMVKEERKRNKSDRKSEDKQAKIDAPRLKVPHDPKHKRRAPKPDDVSSDTDDEGASVSSFSGSITSQASDNSRSRDPKSQHLSVPKPVY